MNTGSKSTENTLLTETNKRQLTAIRKSKKYEFFKSFFMGNNLMYCLSFYNFTEFISNYYY